MDKERITQSGYDILLYRSAGRLGLHRQLPGWEGDRLVLAGSADRMAVYSLSVSPGVIISPKDNT